MATKPHSPLPPGFVGADDEVETPETFRLPGEIGEFMGDLQKYKASVLLTGDPHAGKTQVAYQLADAFAEIYDNIGVLDLEQGGMESRDTQTTLERNVKPENRKKIKVLGELTGGIEQLRGFARFFSVIMIDSFLELNIMPDQLKELRNEFPHVFWIIIGQENQRGTTYGGKMADYIATTVLRVHRVDETFRNNYAQMEKNRSNEIGHRYYFVDRRVVRPTQSVLAGAAPTARPKYVSRSKKAFKKAGAALTDVTAHLGHGKAKNLKPKHTKANWRWAVS